MLGWIRSRRPSLTTDPICSTWLCWPCMDISVPRWPSLPQTGIPVQRQAGSKSGQTAAIDDKGSLSDETKQLDYSSVNVSSFFPALPRFSSMRSCDLTESWTWSKASVAVATRSNFGPLEINKRKSLTAALPRWTSLNHYMSFLRPWASFMVADNFRPSVREMDEWSDFCSLRGVDAIDKSSCNMHE